MAAARKIFVRMQLEREKPPRYFCSMNKKFQEQVVTTKADHVPKLLNLGNYHMVLFPYIISDLFSSHLISLDFISCNLSSNVIWYHPIKFIKSNLIWYYQILSDVFLSHLTSSDQIRSYSISSSLLSFDITCSHLSYLISSDYLTSSNLRWFYLISSFHIWFDIISSHLIRLHLYFS